jgi:hypothetical protein
MTSQRWTSLTLLITVAVGALCLGLNVRLDVFGLFRDSHGRSLPFYGSERRAKFLLSRRHVPENFEAIFLGSSVTGNWNLSAIERFRTYNESLDGGNVSEEKVLAERALRSPGLKLAFCLLHPYFTDSHGLKTEEMSDREYWAALGSIPLFLGYKSLLAEARGKPPPRRWDPSGTEETNKDAIKLPPDLQRLFLAQGDFHVDEVAFEEYRALVSMLHQKGLKVVMVSPPLAETLLESRREAMDHYLTRMRAMGAPEDVLLDFNTSEDAPFRRDPTNYLDGVHLSDKGAAEVVRLLDRRLQEALAR